MADIISLSKVRKARERADATTIAEANRAKFGRSKAEKSTERAARATLERLVDSHRLGPAASNDAVE
jgi:hypothetical protein